MSICDYVGVIFWYFLGMVQLRGWKRLYVWCRGTYFVGRFLTTGHLLETWSGSKIFAEYFTNYERVNAHL